MNDNELDFLEISYIFEIWDIKTRKKIMIELKGACEEEKLEKNFEMALTNLFMLRRLRDPAFFYYILKEINNDHSFLVFINKKIASLISQVIDQPEVIEERIAKGAIHQVNIYPHSSRAEIEQQKKINRVNAIKYLKDRFMRSYDKGDYTEAQVIQSIATDYITDNYWGYTMFKDPLALEGSTYTKVYQYKFMKFLNQNISNLDIYRQLEEMDYELFSFVTLCDYELRKVITNQIEQIIELNDKQWLLFNKLINDLISISSIEWFDSKSKSEKIYILNQIHDFDNLIEYIAHYVVIEERYRAIASLFKKGYYIEGIKLINYLIEDSENIDNFVLHNLYDSLAVAYREIQDYKNALKYFQKAKSLIMYLVPEIQVLKGMIIDIRIAEALHMTGKIDDGRKQFLEIREKLETFDTEIKIKILSNLARGSRRVKEFKTEVKYLLDGLELLELKDPRYNYFHTRSSEILECDLNVDDLYVIEREQQFKQVMFYGHQAIKNFNFAKGLDFFSKAFAIVKDTSNIDLQVLALNSLGYAHFYTNNYEKACEFFRQVLEKDDANRKASEYFIVIFLISNNNTLVEEVKSRIAPLLDKRNYSELIPFVVHLLAQVQSEEKIFNSLVNLSDFLSISRDESFLKFGDILSEEGFLDLALQCYNESLNYTSDPIKYAGILGNLGTIYRDKDQQEGAIQWYQKSLENETVRTRHVYTWQCLAESYGYLMDYINAIKATKKALEVLRKENGNILLEAALEADLEFLKHMSENKININNIESTEPIIRDSLITAERLFLEYYRTTTDRTLDNSLILIEYSKALENILYEKILAILKTDYEKEYRSQISANQFKKANPLLKKIILSPERRTLTPNQWINIIDKIQTTSDPLEAILKKIINKNQTLNIQTIRIVCETISEIRNSMTHHNVLSLAGYLKIRPRFIESLNKLINELY